VAPHWHHAFRRQIPGIARCKAGSIPASARRDGVTSWHLMALRDRTISLYRFFGKLKISSVGFLPLSIWTRYFRLGHNQRAKSLTAAGRPRRGLTVDPYPNRESKHSIFVLPPEFWFEAASIGSAIAVSWAREYLPCPPDPNREHFS
jgi:hypothetical protein